MRFDMSDTEQVAELPLLEKAQERVKDESLRDRSKAQQQEFFLPVNGFVSYYPEEVNVINHPAFQRLSKINQLGQAHYVFRGATHKRSEHVLGAVGVVEGMIDAVNLNAEKAKVQQETHSLQDWREPLNESEERFIRLGALLHDIGHLAAGHTLEDELGLFGKHDEDTRLDYIFGDC
jgi:HD superfamily phosphohydrolase